ncbi:hypothetical protein K6U06_04950 [Acidiferrimicrobium sp. IK]|uniref:hypothetical protein n=1 Tax=Acidiferrimicrobium sp. IK TaxID=2871700 RepID=UPI0021CB4A42|nr:hypothetical protein [Acidiferrimicrobium sp. IK]MCU4183698.1 hypothetical protein [Acidiferrimicrobium sp. IK]
MTPVGGAAAAALVRRPDLWVTAARVGLRLARPGWWRRWPPRPWPDAGYLRFRMETMYGSSGAPAVMSGEDLVGYLEWCRRLPGRAR